MQRDGTGLPSLRETLQRELARTVPPGSNVFHYLGGVILLLLGVELVTGLLLAVYYRPAAGAAFESVATITDEVRLGWLVRGVHAWGADLLIGLCMLHLYRVYLSRAYVRPRQTNWMIGAVLLICLFATAFTGIVLRWDQYGYWYTASAQETISRIPLVGTAMLALFWGGWELGEEVLVRFHALHVGVLPWLGSGLLLAHVLLVWRFGIKGAAGGARQDQPAPSLQDVLLNLLIVCLLLGGVLVTLAAVAPPSLWQRADPLTPSTGVQPPWYLLPVRGLLRSLPGGWAALVVTAVFLAFLAVPVADRRPALGRVGRTLQVLVGVGALAVWLGLGVVALVG